MNRGPLLNFLKLGVFGAFLLAAGGASAQVVTESCTDCPLRIPPLADGTGPGTTTSVLNIGTNGTISDLDVFVNLTHTFDSDLEISLQHVGTGTTVMLSADNGGAGDDYTNTVFDDEAATSITAGTPPFTGSFIPEQALSAFDGEDLSGQWNLIIFDDAGGDEGTLLDWSITADLTAQGAAPAAVPTLSEWAMILMASLLALVAAAGLRRGREPTQPG